MPSSPGPVVLSSLTCSSFRALHVAGVVVVRWFGHTSRAEYAELAKLILEAAAATDETVDLVALVSTLPSPPRPELFDATVRFGAATRHALGATHVVLEGTSGFWRTIVQSVTTRATTALGLQGKVAMHPSADDALARANARQGVHARDLRAVLEREGLLSAVPDESGAYVRSSSDAAALGRRSNGA